ncbi:MAG: thiamine-phosphate pyrophosphorylase [Deltaproteobacteria bacterium]
MSKHTQPGNRIVRIIDANINRAKEGLRVCEEVTRFILESRALTQKLKKARHKIDLLLRYLPAKAKLLQCRKAGTDVGRKIRGREFERKDFQDIFFANIQRVKESLRVLEEFAKLECAKAAAGFKEIRYDIYEIEKKIIKKFPSLSNHR